MKRKKKENVIRHRSEFDITTQRKYEHLLDLIEQCNVFDCREEIKQELESLIDYIIQDFH